MSVPYRYVIGLEVHVELATVTKMFCRCLNDPFGAEPNQHTCPVCFGLPGALPVPNIEAVRRTVLTGLALGATIPEHTKFDRKHYYYPDLPKGYQISQYQEPLAIGGHIEVPGSHDERSATIRFERVHLEEDAGKLLHGAEVGFSLVDLNRAGVPLMEMVSKPDLTSPAQARRFLKEIQLLVRAIGVSEADMEKGQLRCDVNVSLQFSHEGQDVWTPITEIKNVNSTKAVERGLVVEGKRLYEEWVANGPIRSRTTKLTAGWDERTETVNIQRVKEEANDYRYFPEPDIPAFSVYALAATDPRLVTLPELPAQMRLRYQKMGLLEADSELLLQSPDIQQAFEASVSAGAQWKPCLNILVNAPGSSTLNTTTLVRLSQMLERRELAFAELSRSMTSLIKLLQDGEVLEKALSSLNLVTQHDSQAVQEAIKNVLSENPLIVEQYRSGEHKVVGFLIGQVMKQVQGKAAAATVSEQLLNELQK